MHSHETREGKVRAGHHLAAGRAYADAAKMIFSQDMAGTRAMPFFALVAHGFELAFKVVLIRNGWSEDRLMLIGHDISRCRDAALSRGDLVIDDTTAKIVDALGPAHARQCFRYPQPVTENAPDAATALDCLHRLIDKLGASESH